MAKKKQGREPDTLQGWRQIAQFLGQPVTVAQHWARTGMPVHREGRYMTSTRAALNQWLGKESRGEPVQITTSQTDLAAELKRGLSYVRKQRKRAA
jgi:hypothetical protein